MIRRFFATVAIAALGTTVVGVGIALAADIEVSPEQPETGPAELTIRVGDFPPNTPIYAVPCAVPADGTEVSLGTDDCDVTAVVTAVTDAAGAATLTVEWTIPDDGIAVYVGDETREHQATTVITPAPPSAPGDEADADDDAEVAVLGTSVVQEDEPDDDLADTGPREIVVLGMIGTALIGLGIAFQNAERLGTDPTA